MEGRLVYALKEDSENAIPRALADPQLVIGRQ
jgi:hypothetical protein